MSHTLEQSQALHGAIARYRVQISRRVPRAEKVEIATGLTYAEAKALQDKTDERLSIEEPQWVGCMCRSLALVELINGPEVARILGYGPSFCYERAVASVEAFLRDGEVLADLAVCVGELPEASSSRAGLRLVVQRFKDCCLGAAPGPDARTLGARTAKGGGDPPLALKDPRQIAATEAIVALVDLPRS